MQVCVASEAHWQSKYHEAMAEHSSALNKSLQHTEDMRLQHEAELELLRTQVNDECYSDTCSVCVASYPQNII